MVAEVSSSLVRLLSGHIEEQPQIHAGKSDILITKDLLGSLSKAATKDIDLEFKLQDLNFPPINFFEDMTSLDLKLQSSTPSHYQSVCTLDKVKYALERAEKETMKKRSSSPPSLPATSSSTSGMFAAACPGCLLYVIASKTNPICPRCNSFVPSASAVKKPRIDLNASF
ncbi:hypothetical protein CRYUN_Cryun37aG0074500 [Craigia yunnanensis]